MEKINEQFIQSFIKLNSEKEFKEYFHEFLETNFNAKILELNDGYLLDFDGEKFLVKASITASVEKQ